MKKTFGFNVHDMVEIAMLVALAIILDQFLKISIGATGGSINLSALPLLIISFRHGPFKGFIGGGIIFGFITCLIDGYGLITYPLEYFLAFGIIGFLGFFSHFITKSFQDNDKKKIVLSYAFILLSSVVILLVRLLGATLDSMILYEYKFVPALVYNISYIGPSSLIVTICFCVLVPILVRINNFVKSNYLSE